MVRAEETPRVWKAYTRESTHTELSGVFEQRTLTGRGRLAIFIFNQGNANSVYANPAMERPAVAQIHSMKLHSGDPWLHLYPAVSGVSPLTKKPEDSGCEMGNYNETFT